MNSQGEEDASDPALVWDPTGARREFRQKQRGRLVGEHRRHGHATACLVVVDGAEYTDPPDWVRPALPTSAIILLFPRRAAAHPMPAGHVLPHPHPAAPGYGGAARGAGSAPDNGDE
ncbi:MAG: hypothetical protein ACU0B1_04775 [Thermohalobaculum sp.]